MNVEKLAKLQHFLRDHSLSMAIVSQPETIRLLSEVAINPHERIAFLFVFPTATPLFFVPALEKEAVQKKEPTLPVYSYFDHENPWALLQTAVSNHLNIDASQPLAVATEKQFLSLQKAEALQDSFPALTFKENLSPFFDALRVIKAPNEIQALHQSAFFADKAIEIGKKALKVGITELEVVAEIEYELKKLGITEMSFATMVLFGDHASDPHGAPGKRALTNNEWVLFDLGTMFNGYASDITRTVFFGDSIPQDEHTIFQTVLEAHHQAMKAVKPGITASELDAIARNYIQDAGYGEYFIHRLGHGIGQSCHEFPSIMEGNDLVLTEGMCFSIEPGIYIPHKIGVRIEDCVTVTSDGCVPFTTSSYDALDLG